MNREPVKSSNLKSVGYDPETEILEIEFKNGFVYHYFEVPQSRYDGLMNASSKGSYLNQSIKRKFPYKLMSKARIIAKRRVRKRR